MACMSFKRFFSVVMCALVLLVSVNFVSETRESHDIASRVATKYLADSRVAT
ncbi:hypothetical protein ABC003_03575 [Acinetobacter baumannii]|nr:hypothetical protein ABC003_03575 [Acinetobacter baumannii]